MAVSIHPVLKQLLDLGCSDRRGAPVAFAVYMDLAEVKAVYDLQYGFSEELDLIYLTGKDNETDIDVNVYVPLPSSREVTPEWLLKAQNGLPMTGKKGFILAFKDADSTIVYYQISKGLVPPDCPEEVQMKKSAEEKKRLMHSELWRKRNQLYEMAKTNSSKEEMCNKDSVD